MEYVQSMETEVLPPADAQLKESAKANCNRRATLTKLYTFLRDPEDVETQLKRDPAFRSAYCLHYATLSTFFDIRGSFNSTADKVETKQVTVESSQGPKPQTIWTPLKILQRDRETRALALEWLRKRTDSVALILESFGLAFPVHGTRTVPLATFLSEGIKRYEEFSSDMKQQISRQWQTQPELLALEEIQKQVGATTLSKPETTRVTVGRASSSQQCRQASTSGFGASRVSVSTSSTSSSSRPIEASNSPDEIDAVRAALLAKCNDADAIKGMAPSKRLKAVLEILGVGALPTEWRLMTDEDERSPDPPVHIGDLLRRFAEQQRLSEEAYRGADAGTRLLCRLLAATGLLDCASPPIANFANCFRTVAAHIECYSVPRAIANREQTQEVAPACMLQKIHPNKCDIVKTPVWSLDRLLQHQWASSDQHDARLIAVREPLLKAAAEGKTCALAFAVHEADDELLQMQCTESSVAQRTVERAALAQKRKFDTIKANAETGSEYDPAKDWTSRLGSLKLVTKKALRQQRSALGKDLEGRRRDEHVEKRAEAKAKKKGKARARTEAEPDLPEHPGSSAAPLEEGEGHLRDSNGSGEEDHHSHERSDSEPGFTQI